MVIRKFIKMIVQTDWIKTIKVNFHYFVFRDAIRFPIMISWRTVLKTVGGVVFLDDKVTSGMLLFGYKSLGTIDAFYERTIWDIEGLIKLQGRYNSIGRGSKFCVRGVCTIGGNLTITGRSELICQKKITFGKDVLISWDVLIMDSDFHEIMDESGIVQNEDMDVVFGSHIWIGCRTTIMKGTVIPNNCVIAAGSLISGKLLREGCVYTSNKNVLREHISWQR